MSLRKTMRCLFILALSLNAWHWGVCQEKAVLDSSVTRASALKPIVGGRSSAGAGKIIDGLQPAPQVMLTIEQIYRVPPPGSNNPVGTQILYEIRLRNTDVKPISLPANPNRDQVIAQCGSSPMVESAFEIGAKESTSTKSRAGQWQDYYGCAQVGSTMILLKPGEWVTYRGTTTVPSELVETALLEGSWLLSSVRYTTVANGFLEDSDLVLSAHSDAQRIR